MVPKDEDAIARLENAWRSGRKPAIAAILRDAAEGATESELRELAIELVKVDLEYRWRAAQARGRRSALKLEAYAGRLRVLGPVAELPLDLIAEEYRVRRRFGDSPEVQEYFARFTHPRADLAASLEMVSRELAEEGEPVVISAYRAPRLVRHIIDPEAPLYYGDYVLKRQIGSGGLCRVYAGLQLSLKKEVGIKVLRRRFGVSGDAVAAFLREAQVVARLPPEGLVSIHGVGRLPRGGYFMVMDLVDGQDLRAKRLAGNIRPTQAAQWVAAAAEIVSRVHAAGFVHGDLKPANVLVEYGGCVLLTDFGFARPIAPVDSPRRSEVFGGTPAFLAPEVAAEAHTASGPAIDVFGLGSVLLWLLTGRAVHEGTRKDLLLTSLAKSTWDARVEARMPALTPVGLVELCRRCLNRTPDDRPPLEELEGQCRRFASAPDSGGA